MSQTFGESRPDRNNMNETTGFDQGVNISSTENVGDQTFGTGRQAGDLSNTTGGVSGDFSSQQGNILDKNESTTRRFDQADADQFGTAGNIRRDNYESANINDPTSTNDTSYGVGMTGSTTSRGSDPFDSSNIRRDDYESHTINKPTSHTDNMHGVGTKSGGTTSEAFGDSAIRTDNYDQDSGNINTATGQGDTSYGLGTKNEESSGEMLPEQASGKPKLTDKIKGTVEQVAGSVTRNTELKERGQERKTGGFADSPSNF